MPLWLAAVLVVVVLIVVALVLTKKKDEPAAAPAAKAPEKGEPPAARAPDDADKGPETPKKDTPRKDETPSSKRGRPSGGQPEIESERSFLPDEGETTQPNPLVLVTGVGRTDAGLRRQNNEDAFLVLESHDLFVVADGMGRHKAGEVASRMAVDTVAGMFASGEFGKPKDESLAREANRLLAAFDEANRVVFQASVDNDSYAGMGTTMVALHFSRGKDRAAIGHAGDSRCYRLRAGKLEQLTVDHTLGAAGIVGPSANVLSRAVGIEENLEADVQLIKPELGDVFLVCSDGLSRMVTVGEIRNVLQKETDLDKAANELIHMANVAGGRDNVTVILVRVDRSPVAGGG